MVPIGADEALLQLVPNVFLTEADACQNHLNALGMLAGMPWPIEAAPQLGRDSSPPAATPRNGGHGKRTESLRRVKPRSIRPVFATAEVELLLCCARRRPSTDCPRIEVLLKQKIDWVRFIQLAFAHGSLSLMHAALSSVGPEHVPKAMLEQLRHHRMETARRGEHLQRELLRIIGLLEARDIPTIAFKGPVLAQAVYGDLGLRPFSDLDLLVPKRDFLKAKGILIRDGYDEVYFGEHETLYRQSQLVRSDQSVGVDLHWGVSPRDFDVTISILRKVARSADGSVGHRPGPNILSRKHRADGVVARRQRTLKSLNRLCDLHEVIAAHPGLNWTALLETVRLAGGERRFLLALRMVKDLFDTPLPAFVSSLIDQRPILDQLASQIENRLFLEGPAAPAEFEKCLGSVGLTDDPRRRFRRLVRFAITPSKSDLACFRLPTILDRLYFVLRPGRLALRCAAHPIEAARTIRSVRS
ncbi:MAG: nucleotidyltransferase family protein [Verrucomicrobiota bacterium]